MRFEEPMIEEDLDYTFVIGVCWSSRRYCIPFKLLSYKLSKYSSRSIRRLWESIQGWMDGRTDGLHATIQVQVVTSRWTTGGRFSCWFFSNFSEMKCEVENIPWILLWMVCLYCIMRTWNIKARPLPSIIFCTWSCILLDGCVPARAIQRDTKSRRHAHTSWIDYFLTDNDCG